MIDARQERALNDLEVALALIPEHEKEDYLQAIQSNPMLVSVESDPLRFLRFTNYNAPAAAISLTRYWKTRKEAFGDKAFLPFTLTRDGSLEDSDLACIRTGVSLTPLKDNFGRSLFFFDISRRVVPENRLKYLFYLYQHAMENDLTQTDGCVMVVILADHFKMYTDSDAVRSYKSAFPNKVKVVHIVRVKETFTIERIKTLVLKTYSKVFGGHDIYFHDISKGEPLTLQLEPYGIDSSSVPISFGGTWSYWNVHAWIRTQQEKNVALYKDVLPARTAEEGLTTKEIYATRNRLPLKKRAKTTAHGAASLLAPPINSSHATYLSASYASEQKIIPSLFQQQSLQSALFNWEASLEVKKYEGMISLDPDLIDFICSYFDSALQDLGEAESQAVVKASSMASNLVWAEESNPFLFILCEDFHLNYAAKRLARYWTFRQELFGNNACLLLHQTGEGALKRQTDLSVLDIGFVNLLPHDDRDCSVVFVDTDRLANYYLTDCHKRCLFYIFSVATENRRSQRDGITIILRFSNCSAAVVASVVDFTSQVMSCLPLRFKSIHILTSVVASRIDKFREDVGRIVYIHENTSGPLAATILGRFNLKRENLPVCVGGDWGYSDFNLWQELRTRVEWNIPLGLVGSRRLDMPGMKVYTEIDDKRERQRRMNVVHSWRKRARHRIERADLEEKCVALKDEQHRLLTTHSILEPLLSAARKVLDEG